MKYTTTNELAHFGFAEAYISDIQKISGYFQLTLDNVMISPDCSKNRDVREMRANEWNLKIREGTVASIVEEGYKVYNADGKLMEEYEDKPVTADQYNELLKSFTDGECCVISLEVQRLPLHVTDDSEVKNTYLVTIDASNGHAYVLEITGTGDFEEWNRFLNK